MSLQPPVFKHITEDVLREWKRSNAAAAPLKLPGVPLPRFLYELCWTLVRGDLALQKCKTALESVEFAGRVTAEDVASVFADIIAHLVQDPLMTIEYRARLVKLVKWLVESAIIPSRIFQERCEEEFLWESELTKIKAQDLKAKEVRVNTRLLYQQTKFNLLREESEGYAKLVTLLCQGGLETAQETAPESTISLIKSLIGHFDLDPNRVFDIVLECFELFPDNRVFYDLIPIFPKSHASQILGFKFQYYQRMEVEGPAPFSLYRLTALLIKAELIDLDSIWGCPYLYIRQSGSMHISSCLLKPISIPYLLFIKHDVMDSFKSMATVLDVVQCLKHLSYAHLLPRDGEAFDHYDAFLSKSLDEVKKIGKINLAATGKDLLDEEKQEGITDLYLALDMESDSVAERAPELENNQCLGLLMGFLSVNDWHHAHILFDRLAHLNPAEHVQISDGLIRVIEKTIAPAYAVVCQLHSHKQNEASTASSMDAFITSNDPSSHFSSIDLHAELFQMLSVAGPYLYRDAVLLQKICRVLRMYYIAAQDPNKNLDHVCSNAGGITSQDIQLRQKDAKLKVESALGTCVLPSLQLIPANPAIGQEIWEVLCLLPYETRYRLYGEWEKEDERLPVVLSARQIARLETRRLLKRLAKENLKQKGRMVAKLAHANPMTVLRTIIHQIEAYRDMITPVVDAFKYLTQLEYDILEFVVIERLAHDGREKLKDDGLNLSDWLQSLASFWGHLCKKYPSMELRGLFQYLVNQLKKGIGIELVLLQELIQQMANVQYTENMTEEQLDAMAGSETLRYQATSFGMTRNNKALLKSTNRLRDSLLPKDEPKLAIPLLLLISQHRSIVVANADGAHIKMVSEQFDRCHGTLLQYVEFLHSALSPTTVYAQLIPTLDDLVHKYHLEPEVVFLIYRPIMKLFKCSSQTEVAWPLDCLEGPLIPDSEDFKPDNQSADLVLDLGPCRAPIRWSDLMTTVHSMLPSKAWNGLSPELYTTFWGLTLYDLHVPKGRYEAEIAKQHTALKALEELSDNSSSAITKRKKDKERIQELLDKLMGELQKHEQHVESVNRRLSREKDGWLSSCSDMLKINVEFFQRCIFPRCIFSMSDAVYCAKFVHTLHLLGTPYFNTVHHIDVFICKTLQPMICCCTEYEAGRLGRFLYETLKMAYHWKSDEAIYERECGNKPGFAIYYRYPNSQRVTFGQFVRIHLKWSAKITKLFIQCLESIEYMEIRNALITLTKISSIFPVTRKSGVNLEKRVAKIKLDEREDLKVLATGVSAALAVRKSSWVSEEEFTMGYFVPKQPSSPAKSLASNLVNLQNGSAMSIPPGETGNSRNGTSVLDSLNCPKDQVSRAKLNDGKQDSVLRSDLSSLKVKASSVSNNVDAFAPLPMPSASKSSGTSKTSDDIGKASPEETIPKAASKVPGDSDKPKRSTQAALSRQARQEVIKDDGKAMKSIGRITNQFSNSVAEKDIMAHHFLEGQRGGAAASVNAANSPDVDSGEVSDVSRSRPAPFIDDSVKYADKQQKRLIVLEEQDRLKRRKGENEAKDGHALDLERLGSEEHSRNKPAEKLLDKSRDKAGERLDKDHREKIDRSSDRTRSEGVLEKARDRSMERYGRERSLERAQDRGDRGTDRLVEKGRDDKVKDERNKTRHGDMPSAKQRSEDNLTQTLPPPPPLSPSTRPESVAPARQDEEPDRRSAVRHAQKLSPRHDEKDRRHLEENPSILQDENKRRREDDLRERKHDEWDVASAKVEDRERDKGNVLKGDTDAAASAASKKRKLKRDLPTTDTVREYSPAVPSLHPPGSLGNSQPFDGRERGDRKTAMVPHRSPYLEETVQRLHGKEAGGKITRREADQNLERDWEEEKRLRNEAKRKHRK